MSVDLIKPILSEPNSINTETYIMNGPYNSKKEAENACSYIKTKFFHFLLGLKKISQHTTQAVYFFVPIQDFSEPWTDEKLYAKYGLTKEEIAFIESMIRPMDLSGGGDE
jgi:site-specific DNA-methyltransferase (adenine-specific)